MALQNACSWDDAEMKEKCELDIIDDAYYFTSKYQILNCLDIAFNTSLKYRLSRDDQAFNHAIKIYKVIKKTHIDPPITVKDNDRYQCKYLDLKEWAHK